MSKLKNMFKERETRVTQLEEKVRQDEEVNKIQLNQLQEEVSRGDSHKQGTHCTEKTENGPKKSLSGKTQGI